MRPVLSLCLSFVFLTSSQAADSVLIEAESFENSGGWELDTQFIDTMGSPYLLAHGLGRQVSDTSAMVELPSPGTYRVFVRTMNWVGKWKAKGHPGQFEVLINGNPLERTFGTESAEWAWQDGGVIDIDEKQVEIGLHDLTGFDGRCDAIFLTKGNEAPPNDSVILAGWRRKLLGLEEAPTARGPYDLVVIGGGYAGMGAALSAARMGCKVALVQNRPVLGGNGSSEVRVWAMGNIRRGKYPRIGEIIEEFCDHAKKSPGTYEEFGDAQKEAIVRAEKNIDLFLNHHAYKVDTEDNRIVAVHAFDTRTSEHSRFTGKLFSDCTGHGTIGYLAKADWNMADGGRMGMSNMWAWANAEEPTTYPETPWALDLVMKDFPYPRDFHGQWFWESGFDKDPLGGAESIRDWNLRAVYGAFNAMKNRDGAAEHRNAYLTWVAYVGGPRESRLLQGDVVLTQDDIIAKKDFPDGCVPSTWSIDLHYPKEQFAEKFKDNPFISYAVHDRRVDRAYGYPVPYRCFYSRNIDNLFMAGRCISVTHEALGTVRVMKTCGMMGEVVGKAASICTLQSCTPRDVYERYLDELKELLVLPGKARRETVSSEITIPKDAMALAGPTGPLEGLDPTKLKGIAFDDRDARKEGKWTEGTGLKGFIAHGYLYAAPNSGSTITWTIKVPSTGKFDVRVSYLPHENRSSKVKVLVKADAGESSHTLNMKVAAPLENDFASIGQFKYQKGESVSVTITSEGSDGNVHADGLQIVPVE
jgi:hypothetical protein